MSEQVTIWAITDPWREQDTLELVSADAQRTAKLIKVPGGFKALGWRTNFDHDAVNYTPLDAIARKRDRLLLDITDAREKIELAQQRLEELQAIENGLNG